MRKLTYEITFKGLKVTEVATYKEAAALKADGYQFKPVLHDISEEFSELAKKLMERRFAHMKGTD